MRAKLIQSHGEQTFAVVFDKGDEFAAGLLEFAKQQNLTAAHFTAVGAFSPQRRRRGGTLQWGGAAFALRPASRWRQRYALVDLNRRELAIFEAKGWGRRPVKVTIDESAPVEPGLLLFAAFVVKGLAEDAAGAAAGAAAATT